MKIQFSYNKRGGPGVFMKRLKKYLVNNFDVEATESSPDLYFSAVWRGCPPEGVKTVHRVDNCYFDTLQGLTSNNGIRKAINEADGVIYQSEFSIKFCTSILGVTPKFYNIIHNGFDQSICDTIKPYKHSYNHLFVACAAWRPIKRPQSTVRAFERAKINNSALVMIGEGARNYGNKHVICTGCLKVKDTYRYHKAATALIHIARMESCPNSVVEALSFGKPVVCNNAGGTSEIVKKDGIIVPLDPPDTFRAFPMKNPDGVNVDVVSEGIRKVININWNINRPDLSMATCAQKYYDFFMKVLSQ